MKRVDGETITGEDLMLVVQGFFFFPLSKRNWFLTSTPAVLLAMHPSLSFLSETPEFQKRYGQYRNLKRARLLLCFKLNNLLLSLNSGDSGGAHLLLGQHLANQ